MGKSDGRGAWLVLMAAICWGTTGTAQAFAPLGATPAAVGAVRLAIGGAVLLLWALARRAWRPGAPWPKGPTLAAAACMAAYQLCFFAAVARTGVAVGTVVAIGSVPMLAGLLGWWLRRERPGRAWLAATLLAVGGCTVLTLRGAAVGGVDPLGVALALGAGAAYVLFTIFSKELVGKQRPEAVMGVVFVLGALMLAPLFWMLDFTWVAEPQGTLVALHLGIITTALAYALFAQGLLSTPVATAATLTLGEPLTAALLGLTLLREPIDLPTGIGVALLLAGLMILTVRPRRPALHDRFPASQGS